MTAKNMPFSDGQNNAVYRGMIVNPLNETDCDFFRYGGLAVNGNGKIVACGDYNEVIKNFPGATVIDHSDCIIIPGLIDLHTHLPQYPATGVGGGKLLSWLNNTIFPLELKSKNNSFAKKAAKAFFRDALSCGTTTTVLFSSIHKQATDIAFSEADKSGIRAYIGKCLMDAESPEYLTDSADNNILDTLELIKKWHDRDKHRLQYIVSPRYAGSCSVELMSMAAKIALDNNLFIQTHLSENAEEIKYIMSLFPGIKNYTEIYDSVGLLTARTLLAHCIHLGDEELSLLAERNCSIVHCPVSNRYLQSGVMPLMKYLDYGLKVGLGTDVAAGYSLSVLNESREAVETTKTFNIVQNTENGRTLEARRALYMATLGASKILEQSDYTGNLSAGKEADFVIIKPDESFFDYYEVDADYIIAKLAYTFSNKPVFRTYVRGICVFEG